MNSLWNDAEALKFERDPLAMRVYTSRLLGKESDLVLHGGGNTSVKIREKDLFGEEEDILYVKGSGWDLATIEKPGFAPVKLEVLKKMADLEHLSDPDMVKYQRAAMTNPNAPNPSVEAILHAIIPFTFVDHTHADAVVTISNTPDGEERINTLYGDRMLIIPYVMPGFILAREIHKRTQDLDWSTIDGMILMNHGVFTFDHNARKAYERMIDIVSEAEDYISDHAGELSMNTDTGKCDTSTLAQLRHAVSQAWNAPVLAGFDNSSEALNFSNLSDVGAISQRGPVTPDHIIRTKRVPLLMTNTPDTDVNSYADSYKAYFDRNNTGDLTCLDPAPRWAVWPGHGAIAFGKSLKDIRIIRDISRHTMKAIRQAEALNSWQALPEMDLFEMEYWVLEQAKLAKNKQTLPLQGKIALVTGGAGGIGKACVEQLIAAGAVVAALDIAPMGFDHQNILEMNTNVTDMSELRSAIERVVSTFGGLDILVSNAGTFPPSKKISDMPAETWQKSMDINLTSHRQLLTAAIPFLEWGIEPAVVIIGSKNVPAPGPGASAYSVAKAGLTQLGRIAALELGSKGIRVNVLHPNAVYDTGIWTDEVLKARAAHYGVTVEEYKTNNVLQTEVSSKDVADLAVALTSKLFSKTTGAQIPIDGGNERVI